MRLITRDYGNSSEVTKIISLGGKLTFMRSHDNK